MTHKGKSLTAAFVAKIKRAGRYYDAHGLFLRVEPSGAKRWIQRLTIRGKRCDIGLGSASFVSLADARDAAFDNRKIARKGGDPLADKKRMQETLTFEEAARKVLELHRPTWRNEKHATQWMSTMEAYAFPKFGAYPVNMITAADVLTALTPIWNEKPETARRVKQRIGVVLKWAIAQGWRGDNPVDAIAEALPKHDATKRKHMKALPYEQIPECLNMISASKASSSAKLGLEFLILTATRSGEMRYAKWDEMDIENATWTIPASRMKNKRPHRVPLSPRAVALLRVARRNSDNDFVFSGFKPNKPLSDATLLKLLRENGYSVHAHGFRTSFRMWAQEQTNFPREVAERALAHTIKNKVEAAYARSDLFDKRRKMMEAWANYLAAQDRAVLKLKTA